MGKHVLYGKDNAVATITLNRPEKHNTLRPSLLADLDDALRQANLDKGVKVIILEGAGDSSCAGFDFSDGFEHYEDIVEENYDPGMDVNLVVNPYSSYLTQFMGLWRGTKPVIAKIHGYCMSGGSEMALCTDIVIASDDARIGTPYSRVWGCHLSGMWIYRLGLAKAKYYALTSEAISGREAARIELINDSCALEELDQKVQNLAEKLARIPLTQLIAMKLVVNRAYDNMGLNSTQILGPILDGMMRNTPDGREFVNVAKEHGVKEAVIRRDRPWEDYSQAPEEERPRLKSKLGL